MRARAIVVSLVVALVLAAVAGMTGSDAVADGPLERTRPSIGYAYPAGGRAGTLVEVVVGGQNLRGVLGAHVSGEGVQADVVRSVRSLSFQQQRELVRRVAAERKARVAASDESRAGRRGRRRDAAAATAKEPAKNDVELPDHPLLNDLSPLTDRGLDDVLMRFVGAGRKKQPNAQLAEMVELLVEIAPGAAPGWHEIRLETRAGLTNPVRFRVGDLAEVNEHDTVAGFVHDLTGIDLPLLVNGQIMAGDVDRFRVRVEAGRRLLVETEARSLTPFLADAVPGWFQAVVRVLAPSGREIAFSDDFGFDPDPRLVVDVPVGGDYVVEIRDSIHRGREDFVYRLAIRDDAVRARTPSARDVPPGFVTRSRHDDQVTREREPNDDVAHAEDALLPFAITGRIERPGDVDVFAFEGRSGTEIVIDVEARRLLSPLDAVIRLVDPTGEVIAWCDDHADPGPGLLTHDADPYLRVRLPRDGAYAVHVADVRGHGGARHDYRLRVGPPRPDFDLVVTPSGVSVPAGRTVPIRVHAIRRDGFEGPIDLALAEAPEGFVLSGARIPAGADSVRMTMTASRRRTVATHALRLEGTARIGGHDVVREATPADDRMQAFILRHLVPAEEWLVVVDRAGARNAPPVGIATTLPVTIPSTRNARVDLRVPGITAETVLHLRLDEPPPGVALGGWEVAAGRLTLFLERDVTASTTRIEDNLIVEVWADVRGRRTFVGHLPAIAIAADGP